MEALVFEKSKKSVTLEKVPIPELVNDDDVQIQVRNCGVCGTDVHIFHGAITNVGDRFIPGHEAGGVVTAIGSKVTGVKVGDNVAVDPNRGCHGCEHCRRSNPHFCPKGSFNDAIGIVRNGGFAPYMVAPAEQVYKVADDFDMQYLSLVEPLSCIVHGWRILSRGRELHHGTQILIQGAGIIGSLWACLLHHKGYRSVTVSEPTAARRQFIDQLKLGFRTVAPVELSGEFGVVIDCSGSVRAIESGLEMVGHGGIFLQFGVAPTEAKCQIRPFHIYEREITIQGVMVNPWTFPEAIELVNLLKDRYLDFATLGEAVYNESVVKSYILGIAKFSLADYEECFTKLASGEISKASFVH